MASGRREQARLRDLAVSPQALGAFSLPRRQGGPFPTRRCPANRGSDGGARLASAHIPLKRPAVNRTEPQARTRPHGVSLTDRSMERLMGVDPCGRRQPGAETGHRLNLSEYRVAWQPFLCRFPPPFLHRVTPHRRLLRPGAFQGVWCTRPGRDHESIHTCTDFISSPRMQFMAPDIRASLLLPLFSSLWRRCCLRTCQVV